MKMIFLKKTRKILVVTTIIFTLFLSMQSTAYAWNNVRMQSVSDSKEAWSEQFWLYNESSYQYYPHISVNKTISYKPTEDFIINNDVIVNFNPYVVSSTKPMTPCVLGYKDTYTPTSFCTITATAHYSDGSTKPISYNYSLPKTANNVYYLYLGQQSITLPATNNGKPMTYWDIAYKTGINCNFNFGFSSEAYATVKFYPNMWASYVEAGDIARESQIAALSDQLTSITNQINNISSSNSTQAIKVISTKPFFEPIFGEYGTPSGTNDSTGFGIKAVTPVVGSSGYTELSGTLTLSAGKKVETKKVMIGSKMFLFKVISSPSITDVATVTFGS